MTPFLLIKCCITQSALAKKTKGSIRGEAPPRFIERGLAFLVRELFDMTPDNQGTSDNAVMLSTPYCITNIECRQI